MKLTAPIILAVAGLSLAACTEDGASKVAPVAPTPTAGLIDAPNSLNGEWNLVAAQCGQAGSKGRLHIAANKFDFAEASCISTSSTVQTNYTSVSLECKGGPAPFNRELNLSLRGQQMRLTEDSKTLTYYRCAAAEVAPGATVTVTTPQTTAAVVKTPAGEVVATAPAGTTTVVAAR